MPPRGEARGVRGGGRRALPPPLLLPLLLVLLIVLGAREGKGQQEVEVEVGVDGERVETQTQEARELTAEDMEGVLAAAERLKREDEFTRAAELYQALAFVEEQGVRMEEEEEEEEDPDQDEKEKEEAQVMKEKHGQLLLHPEAAGREETEAKRKRLLQATANHELALLHLRADLTGGTPYYRKAFSLIRRAADMGHAPAQRDLARVMSFGLVQGVGGGDTGGEVMGTGAAAEAVLLELFSALEGDVFAQMALGHRYRYGYGVPKDCEQAIIFYELAANKAAAQVEERGSLRYMDETRLAEHVQLFSAAKRNHFRDTSREVLTFFEQLAETGDPFAEARLATLYLNGGFNVEPDEQLAAHYMTQAAEHGDASAQSAAALIYARGIGVNPDFDRAIRFAEEASGEGGDPGGVTVLGFMHWQGLGMRRNLTEAVRLLTIGADRGNLEAFYYLGLVYLGENPYERVLQEQLAHVPGDHLSSGAPGSVETDPRMHIKPDKAIQCLTLAAHHSHLLALHKLGHLYASGVHTPRNCQMAAKAFKSVAERADWGANMTLAMRAYTRGDMDAALSRYLALAHAGYELAQSNAGFLLSSGHCLGLSVDECENRALLMWRLSSKQGNAEASLRLGDFFYFGRGGANVSRTLAAEYYKRAADYRHAQAIFNLGVMHQFGLGLKQDLHLAKRYYDQALQTDVEAAWPCFFALHGLQLHRDLIDWVGSERAQELVSRTLHGFDQIMGALHSIGAAFLAPTSTASFLSSASSGSASSSSVQAWLQGLTRQLVPDSVRDAAAAGDGGAAGVGGIVFQRDSWYTRIASVIVVVRMWMSHMASQLGLHNIAARIAPPSPLSGLTSDQLYATVPNVHDAEQAHFGDDGWDDIVLLGLIAVFVFLLRVLMRRRRERALDEHQLALLQQLREQVQQAQDRGTIPSPRAQTVAAAADDAMRAPQRVGADAAPAPAPVPVLVPQGGIGMGAGEGADEGDDEDEDEGKSTSDFAASVPEGKAGARGKEEEEDGLPGTGMEQETKAEGVER